MRIPPELLRALDTWIAAQPEPMTRPEAIRRITAEHVVEWHRAKGKALFVPVDGPSPLKRQS